jgi:hypothetical protein
VTPGRKVKEWIGKTPDTQVPEVVQLRILLAHDRKDWRTGQDIRPGDTWQCDHKIAICNGGENRESNLGPILVESHKEKTAEDREEKRKTDAMARAAFGINKSKRPMKGGQATPDRERSHSAAATDSEWAHGDRAPIRHDGGFEVSASAYPLAWPDNFPRSTRRETGQFKTALASALKNVETSLARFGKDSNKPVANIVLSSNCALGMSRPEDPGVAVWFTWDGLQVCIPVDRYTTPEANLQAIHHVLEARRTELRHGTLALVRATMTGFVALPAPGARPWWDVLGVDRDASVGAIEVSYRLRAKDLHPDHGGSHEAMADLNKARHQALKERGK